VAVGHTGQRPGALSVVGYGAGQGTQDAEPRVASGLYGIRPGAGRERPVVAVTCASVIAVGRAGLRTHLACNGRSREHRCKAIRTRTPTAELCFLVCRGALSYTTSERPPKDVPSRGRRCPQHSTSIAQTST